LGDVVDNVWLLIEVGEKFSRGINLNLVDIVESSIKLKNEVLKPIDREDDNIMWYRVNHSRLRDLYEYKVIDYSDELRDIEKIAKKYGETIINEDGTFKPLREIIEIFRRHNIDDGIIRNDRQQQVNSFLNKLTQNEIDKYIYDNKINHDYLESLMKIKNRKASRTHSDRIAKKIFDSFANQFNRYSFSMYKFGQAQIMAFLLRQSYNKDYKADDIRQHLRILMDNDKELKEYVYEIMKDY